MRTREAGRTLQNGVFLPSICLLESPSFVISILFLIFFLLAMQGGEATQCVMQTTNSDDSSQGKRQSVKHDNNSDAYSQGRGDKQVESDLTCLSNPIPQERKARRTEHRRFCTDTFVLRRHLLTEEAKRST